MASHKVCIACAEEILSAAKLCKHCGTSQDDTRFNAVKPALLDHECHHPSLADWHDYFKGDPGIPKLERILPAHSEEKVVAYFYKVSPASKKGSELFANALIHEAIHLGEMIFTNENLIIASYDDPGSFEVYPLNSIESIEIHMELIDRNERLVFTFNNLTEISIRSRYVSLGKRDRVKKEAWGVYSRQLLQLGAHVLLLKGQDLVSSTNNGYFYGIGFSQPF